MNQPLPVFDLPQRNGVPCGIGAVATASALRIERLDLQELPNAPNAPRPN